MLIKLCVRILKNHYSHNKKNKGLIIDLSKQVVNLEVLNKTEKNYIYIKRLYRIVRKEVLKLDCRIIQNKDGVKQNTIVIVETCDNKTLIELFNKRKKIIAVHPHN